MPVLDHILGSLRDDAPVRDLRLCVRATAVWSRRLGLAYTFPRVHRRDGAEARCQPGRLSEMSARQMCELARSDDLLDASVGLAAINSLLQPDPHLLRDGNAVDLVMARGEGRDVTVVGHFPFTDRLREKARNLWVLELVPGEGDLPSNAAARVIPHSDVVAVTGTTLINHTIDGLLELARGKFVVVLGPTTPLAPALLELGVSVLGGCVVDDPPAILRTISEGACFRRAPGMRYVTLRRD